ncbi:YqaI-like protein [Planomicrobium soli]|uniref:YqaI-like protein n=1 Tax=Planomicrobium soli TaxID=1176648 RepID=A0A2P8H7J2_9BACL|nr:hypothetical protein [Planomicrobium soli]PSL42161.1 YqaI-like protein [Planomicrobium soli]
MQHPDIERAMRTGYPFQDISFAGSEPVVFEPEIDHPIEDMFGSEIQSGDTWFEDKQGRIVLEENIEDYLLEVVGGEFFKAKK